MPLCMTFQTHHSTSFHTQPVAHCRWGPTETDAFVPSTFRRYMIRYLNIRGRCRLTRQPVITVSHRYKLVVNIVRAQAGNTIPKYNLAITISCSQFIGSKSSRCTIKSTGWITAITIINCLTMSNRF